MKPFSSGIKVANWLIRLALIIFVLVFFKEGVYSFDLGSLNFYVSLLFSVAAVLLLVGGFTSKPNLSVLSGLSLLILAILKIVFIFSGTLSLEVVSLFLIAAVGFYFFCYGK